MRAKALLRGGLWSVFVVLVVAHLGGGWLFSGDLIEDGFTPDPDSIILPEEGLDLMEVTYASPLGDLQAWHIPAGGTTWVIHVHGKGATPAEAEHLFAPLQQAGYPQLAITYRNDEGQPLDPSGYYNYGATEWEDVKGAVEFAQANGARRLVLSGFSTGASHVLSYVFRNNLDVIKGVVLDSPNIDFGDTVDFNAGQREMPLVPMKIPPTIAQVAKFITSLRIGVNWKAIDYVEKADGSLRVPVLIHHGTSDESVPVTQSIDFAERRSDLVRLFQVRDAGHVESYDADPDAYVANVLEFLEQVG